MSTQKKERVIYIAGLALFVITMVALCFPFLSVGVYDQSTSNVTSATQIKYLGWQMFKLINPYITKDEIDLETGEILSSTPMSISPIGTEALFVIFTAVLLIGVCILAVLDGFALYRNLTGGKAIGKKYINLIHIAYFIFATIMVVASLFYVNYLNTHEFENPNNQLAEATGWSQFAFTYLCPNIRSAMGPTPFILAIAGAGAMAVSLIFTMQIQDNTILYPYKKRQVISSILTILACGVVFVLPFIDYFFSTEVLSDADNMMKVQGWLFRSSTVFSASTLRDNGLENVAANFFNGEGWNMIKNSSGGIEGYYKVLFIVMFVVATCGIIYAVLNLLGAAGVIRFNFHRSYLGLTCAILMILGILLWFGSFAYSLGVNVRLEDFYQENKEVFEIAYPEGFFPKTVCTLGAWLSMLPGIAGFVAVKVVNSYDD